MNPDYSLPLYRVSQAGRKHIIDETFDIGCDTRTPVDDSYDVPFHFTGKIDRLTYKLGPEKLMEEDHKAKALAQASVNS